MMSERSWLQDMTLAELLAPFTDINLPHSPVRGISSNSRDIDSGHVFVARPGQRAHGFDFIEQVVDAGAVAVLFDAADDSVLTRLEFARKKYPLPLVPVAELDYQCGFIAARLYGQPTSALTLVGVTGTDGKTSVVHLAVQALQKMGSQAGSVGTLGYGLGNRLQATGFTTPQACQLQTVMQELQLKGCDTVVMEVSSHALQQYRVNGCEFDVAVLTNLGSDHLDFHHSLEHYRNAKERLFHFASLKSCVLNGEDDFGQSLSRKLAIDKVIYTSVESDVEVGAQQKTVQLVRENDHAQGINIDVDIEGEVITLQTGLVGRFNINNLLACAALLYQLGYKAQQIAVGLDGVTSVPGRMQFYPADQQQPATIIDYAHTAQGLEACLTAVQDFEHRRLLCVFGCGGDRDREKRPQMANCAERYADEIIVTDDNPRYEAPEKIVSDILQGFQQPDQVRVIHDRQKAIETALQEANRNDLVVIVGKGHEAWQLVGDQRIPYSDIEVVEQFRQGASA